MEKIIRIGKESIKLKATAKSLIIYRANFGRDGLHDINNLFSVSAQNEINIYPQIVRNILWCFAKTADDSVLPYNEWIEHYKLSQHTLIATCLPVILEIQGLNMLTTIESKQISKNSRKTSLSTEILIRRAISRGLSLSDFEQMTIGMIIDYAIACQNEDEEARKQKPDENTRAATQDDIDAF